MSDAVDIERCARLRDEGGDVVRLDTEAPDSCSRKIASVKSAGQRLVRGTAVCADGAFDDLETRKAAVLHGGDGVRQGGRCSQLHLSVRQGALQERKCRDYARCRRC